MGIPADSGCTAKQTDTILSLSEGIGSMLSKFSNTLDNKFQKTKPDCEKTPEAIPEIPNILDEILENLERGKVRLAEIMSFVSSEVLPKIS